MKKLFLLLTSISLLVFSACDTKDEYGERDPGASAAEMMHFANSEQLICNMDPFWVALRLNSLLYTAENYGEGGIPLEDERLSRATTALLGGTTFTYDDRGVFTLKLGTGGTDDLTRSGTITINTNNSTLKPGVSWTVDIPESDPYTSSGNDLIDISAESYRITCSAENVWKATISGFVSVRETETGIGESDWSGTITIEQQDYPGDQGYDKFFATKYAVSAESASKTVTMYISDTMRVQTVNPLIFNVPKCGFHVIVDGSMNSHFTYYFSSPMDFTISTWEEDTNDACNPKVTYQYVGTTY